MSPAKAAFVVIKENAPYKRLSEYLVCGVYEIRCSKNDYRYIGQSKSINSRLYQHIKGLLCGDHVNEELQGDFNKYGIDYFEFRVIFRCEEKNLLSLEYKTMMDYQKKGIYLYNHVAHPGIKAIPQSSFDYIVHDL